MNDTPPQSRLSLNSLPKVMSLNTLPKFQINGQLRDTLTRPAKSIDKGPQEKPWKSIGFIQIFLDWFGRHIDWRIPLLKQVSRWPNDSSEHCYQRSPWIHPVLLRCNCLALEAMRTQLPWWCGRRSLETSPTPRRRGGDGKKMKKERKRNTTNWRKCMLNSSDPGPQFGLCPPEIFNIKLQETLEGPSD